MTDVPQLPRPPRGVPWDLWPDTPKVAKHHLKISDIEKLKTGDKRTILFFDRNFGDMIYNYVNKKYKSKKGWLTLSPKELSDHLYGIEYEHVAGIAGVASDLNFDIFDRMVWEFHIEHTKNYWFPLQNGVVPKGPKRDSSGKASGKRWTSFPKKTKLGWRGPAVLYSSMSKLPKIAYYKDH